MSDIKRKSERKEKKNVLQQHHRIFRAKRGKRPMRSGANTVANLRSKRYQMLKTEGNAQFRIHTTVRARQNQVYFSLLFNSNSTQNELNYNFELNYNAYQKF